MKLFIIYIITLFPIAAQAQQAKEWKLTDSSGSEITDKILLRLWNGSSIDQLKEAIYSYLYNSGYLANQIDVNKVDRLVVVNKGCRFSISNIALSTETNSLSYNALEYLNTSFSSKKVEVIANEVLSFYEDNGYMSASVEINDFDIYSSQCEVALNITVNEGELWNLEDVRFGDVKRVSSDYLKRVIAYKDTMLATPGYLSSARQRLEQTNYFEIVAEPILIEYEGKKTLFIDVKERNPNYIDGIIGYVPDPVNGSQFIGEGRFGLVNALSDGSNLDLLFQRLTLDNSRLNINASQDWFLGLPMGLNGSFTFFQQDTNYQARALSFGAEYYLSSKSTVYGRFESQNISASANNSNTEIDGRRGITTLGYRYRDLDHPRVPLKGLEFKLEFGTGIKNIETDDLSNPNSDERISQRILISELDWYIPVKQAQVLHFSGFFYNNEADFFTEIDLFRFGGASSFRGYTEEQFFASRVGWFNAEYRYLLNRESFLFAFNTVGGFYRPQLVTELNEQFKDMDLLYSFGFGLSYLTRAGQLSFSYAISPQDDIANGKVHFGIITAL